MHPLSGTHGAPIGKAWAGVKAERKGDEFHLVDGPIVVLKIDALIAPLPAEYLIFGTDGEPVLPSPGKRFFMTLETSDPFHVLTEMQ